MSYLLFVDESGQDRRESPYEVLAGLAIEDRNLWPLIIAVQRAERDCFGGRYASAARELKATHVLKAKTFHLAEQLPEIDAAERRALSRRCLDDGASAGRRELTALAQAKLAFAAQALQLSARFGCAVFASITTRDAPRSGSDFLRKDYAYLFERFYYYLEKRGASQLGLVVFDELERSRSHLLIDQMSRYFQETRPGRERARQVIPEPFFVHSDLTTAIQLADLVAYIIAWGLRVRGMREPARQELAELGKLVETLQAPTLEVLKRGRRLRVGGFSVLDDLRPQPRPIRTGAPSGTQKEKAMQLPAKPPLKV